METKPLRAAIYARVSTKSQSCGLQLSELMGWCKRHEFEVHEVYEDWGISGRRAKRPSLEKLMKDARSGHFKIVVVYSLCRFGRSVADVVRNVLELDAIGVRFITTTQSIDTNNKSPIARLTLQLFAALAEFEVDVTTERIRDGIDHAKEFGTRSGNPFGRPRRIFRREQVAQFREQGLSIRQIAKQLGVGKGTVERCLSQNQSGKVVEMLSDRMDLPA